MTSTLSQRIVSRAYVASLLGLPATLIAVFLLHFRGAGRFLDFRWQYVPRAPAEVVAGLIASGGRVPVLHDPHVMAYLALPLFLVVAAALYALGRAHRPLASLAAAAVSFTGVIYLGGLFGMWAAFYAGLSRVDPAAVAGATQAFEAMTAPRGAFLLTTTLAKLAFVGSGAQALTISGLRTLPRWSPWWVVAGCALFLAFWDLDNWMLIGATCLLTGFVPMARALANSTGVRAGASATDAPTSSADSATVGHSGR